jgi:hypothetical protein
MVKIHNNRAAIITLQCIGASPLILQPGANEVEDDRILAIADDKNAVKYVEALVKEGELIFAEGSGIAMPSAVDADDVEEAMYAHDAEGNRIQKVDNDNELVFDEESGEPVWLLASEVQE